MEITKYVKDPRMVRAILGLSYQTFQDLVPSFENALHVAAKNKPHRIRAVGGGRRGVLPDARSKLFFVLFYLKTYPTFDVLSFLFGKQRSRACEDIHTLLPLLEKVLGHELVLPIRQMRSVEEFLERFPEVKDIFPDGTERRIEHPKDEKRNRRMYSGKKKAHTRKHIVVADEKKRILILTPAKPGRRHDKRALDGRMIVEQIPASVGIWTDSGFQGIHKQHPNVHVPKRGSKKKPLTKLDKEQNHIIASFRVVAEHAIGGMKRFRIMRDVLRNKIGSFDERISRICAGLWNLYLRYAN
jgi:hypothetical protein